MEARELMIGDWVMLRPPMGRFDPPEPFLISDPDDLYMASRFEPIRLTNGLLKEFGFTEQHRRMWLKYVVGNSHFVIEPVWPRNMSVTMNEEFAGSFEILYVHELQHLLRLLKIEMNVKL